MNSSCNIKKCLHYQTYILGNQQLTTLHFRVILFANEGNVGRTYISKLTWQQLSIVNSSVPPRVDVTPERGDKRYVRSCWKISRRPRSIGTTERDETV